MAKTAKKSKKDNKPKPQRTAGRKGQEAKPKEAAKEAAGPIGHNITDAELESAIRKLQRKHSELEEAQKAVNSVRGEIRSVYKGLKAKGVDNDALSDLLRQAKLDDQGARYVAWRARLSKIMNLPLGTQLDLLDPDKGGSEASPSSASSAETEKKSDVDVTDETGLVAKANAYHAGEEAGAAAKPRYVPAKWKTSDAIAAEWLRGYDDAQEKNARKIKPPEDKTAASGGPTFGKS